MSKPLWTWSLFLVVFLSLSRLSTWLTEPKFEKLFPPPAPYSCRAAAEQVVEVRSGDDLPLPIAASGIRYSTASGGLVALTAPRAADPTVRDFEIFPVVPGVSRRDEVDLAPLGVPVVLRIVAVRENSLRYAVTSWACPALRRRSPDGVTVRRFFFIRLRRKPCT